MHRFFISFILLMILFCAAAQCEEYPLRLHVIAESNEKEAQEIKLSVKDSVLKKALMITKDAKCARDAYAMLFTSIGEIRACARETAMIFGFTGEIEAVVTREYFPARLYGDILLDEGMYPALLIKIGQAQGRNWWCVIYPDLCLYGEETKTGEIQFYSKFGYWLKRWIGRWSL